LLTKGRNPRPGAEDGGLPRDSAGRARRRGARTGPAYALL